MSSFEQQYYYLFIPAKDEDNIEQKLKNVLLPKYAYTTTYIPNIPNTFCKYGESIKKSIFKYFNESKFFK